MQPEWVLDPHELAQRLHTAYAGRPCVVNLRRQADKVGQTVMHVERVYVDSQVGTTRTLRVLGHLPDSDEHGTIALPLDGPTGAELVMEGPRAAVTQGDYRLNIVPLE